MTRRLIVWSTAAMSASVGAHLGWLCMAESKTGTSAAWRICPRVTVCSLLQMESV
jgi:hypothetical protein